ncbi:hemin uptake protein HemP [Pseudohoeflea coraliihabitans]|uniref:Hemin uptake protein HemP n=1 Tax=Pseudohoeflea coraliihabitans TaxID=2860393 RepID=A0ABS6WRM3_9HYPH|nr:hemin uptake protein HemP [Pseudohoeflea sp. DP4N28-3]MBW3097710.1 hemin uptake protein HemP [Pseudohoeflea sp. DP4N28-3]
MSDINSQTDRDRASSSESIPAPATPASFAPQIPVFDSKQLFGTSNEIGITHQGALYRLKITRQDRLILNK